MCTPIDSSRQTGYFHRFDGGTQTPKEAELSQVCNKIIELVPGYSASGREVLSSEGLSALAAQCNRAKGLGLSPTRFLDGLFGGKYDSHWAENPADRAARAVAAAKTVLGILKGPNIGVYTRFVGFLPQELAARADLAARAILEERRSPPAAAAAAAAASGGSSSSPLEEFQKFGYAPPQKAY